MYNTREYQYTNTTGAATTQVFTGRGTLQAITINTTSGGSIKLIDNTSGTTANIGTLVLSAPVGTYWYNCSVSKGLRIVTAGASDITISWSQ
jgi:hypothetical protein